MLLNNDWEGADFIAIHIDGNTFLKVQLKGRLTLDKKYIGKDIYICFRQDDDWYLYPHDQVTDEIVKQGIVAGTKSWDDKGNYHWGNIPGNLSGLLEQFKI